MLPSPRDEGRMSKPALMKRKDSDSVLLCSTPFHSSPALSRKASPSVWLGRHLTHHQDPQPTSRLPQQYPSPRHSRAFPASLAWHPLFLLLGTALPSWPTLTLSTWKTCDRPPPPAAPHPLDEPLLRQSRGTPLETSGLPPPPSLCPCCFLCLFVSFSSSVNKLQLIFKTRLVGHFLCEALPDSPLPGH